MYVVVVETPVDEFRYRCRWLGSALVEYIRHLIANRKFCPGDCYVRVERGS